MYILKCKNNKKIENENTAMCIVQVIIISLSEKKNQEGDVQ